jgi:Skp family chaperone for outer membrane proteins
MYFFKLVLDKKNIIIANDTLDITEDIYNLINKELN